MILPLRHTRRGFVGRLVVEEMKQPPPPSVTYKQIWRTQSVFFEVLDNSDIRDDLTGVDAGIVQTWSEFSAPEGHKASFGKGW